ncbi:hypothetical protein RHGRI_028544 [Rhododendron griersonianum]|uniref:Uncharacterized protein n=1 Tax=Rhododendron griersonianum TaxID=479676 RepID=A0AAV6IG60_9ERIC|nr:hypothetical protein RHGRI_028544 [Rhododendron griersonianum]
MENPSVKLAVDNAEVTEIMRNMLADMPWPLGIDKRTRAQWKSSRGFSIQTNGDFIRSVADFEFFMRYRREDSYRFYKRGKSKQACGQDSRL